MKESKGPFTKLFTSFHNQVQVLNSSKIFAGLMIITLNIVSRFVNINLSKSMESYLKYTVSRQLLVFSIAWMGTRDIYIATFITICFIIASEYLFNEDSALCILSKDFQEYHTTLLESQKENEGKVTEDEIKKAKAVLEKAGIQNVAKDTEVKGFSMK